MTSPPTTTHTFVPARASGPQHSGQQSFSASIRRLSTLRSTVVPEGVAASQAASPIGKTIAEGSVVSFFRGGLLAVKIDDDDDVLPNALDTSSKNTSDNSKFSSLGEIN